MTLQDLIATYFPEEERARAVCIAQAEWPVEIGGAQSLIPGLANLVRDEGMVDCGQGAMPAKSYGPFALVDVCWDPAMNPDSPFTADQWANILNPNVNVWAASVVWSHGGWRSWTTCPDCGACEVKGGPIPYPRGPVRDDFGPPPLGGTRASFITAGLAGLSLVALAVADSR